MLMLDLKDHKSSWLSLKFLKLIDGLISLINSNQSGPVNIENSKEFTINDQLQRKSVIDLARKNLGWDPRVDLSEGLYLTIEYFKRNLKL